MKMNSKPTVILSVMLSNTPLTHTTHTRAKCKREWNTASGLIHDARKLQERPILQPKCGTEGGKKKESNAEALKPFCQIKDRILSTWQLMPYQAAIYWSRECVCLILISRFPARCFWFRTFWRQPCVQSARVFAARAIERLMNYLMFALVSCQPL